MTDEIKSFDDLWNEAERRSLKINKNDSTSYIIEEIINIINDFPINSGGIPKELVSSIKQDLIGELLFTLSTITARENINIWSALKKHMGLL